ncbi:MAG TPA: outer membrane beta-barrel protein [Chitinophagaceae bacterium]|nr:outer membrane beta-barrel protein [Chitinophagaceae bacterium]
MKKILSLSACTLFTMVVFSQDTLVTPKKKSTIDLSNRANDHFMLQLGYTKWAGMPDTINAKGLSKSINVYFMFDFPFKTNPRLSIALGGGIGSDHILFTKTYVGIKDPTPSIRFTNQSDTNNFKKTKLATAYFEVPVELRFSSEPMTGKGVKVALGVKVGLLLSAHTRNTKFENKANAIINDYIMKEASKRFMNKTRISGMARIGYANFSLYGSYQFTPLFKDGLGPKVNPFSIGLTLSGL